MLQQPVNQDSEAAWEFVARVFALVRLGVGLTNCGAIILTRRPRQARPVRCTTASWSLVIDGTFPRERSRSAVKARGYTPAPTEFRPRSRPAASLAAISECLLCRLSIVLAQGQEDGADQRTVGRGTLIPNLLRDDLKSLMQ